ncbi:putative DNA-directed RNA polymerase II large subunit [Cryptosporidium felis]|nr:putative DNA-directed RNA polymerase II large subunit [Cryptosporidium felis]
MSSVDSLNIYLKIIDRTIEKSKGLQTPEMLEQLKQRWISKLNDLCLGVTKDGKSGHNQEWVPTELEVIAPRLEGVLPVKLETRQSIQNTLVGDENRNKVDSRTNIDVMNGNGKRISSEISADVPTPMLSSKEMKSANNLGSEYDNLYRMISKRPKAEGDIQSKFNSEYTLQEGSNYEGGDYSNLKSENLNAAGTGIDTSGNGEDDDEFGDASWDIVAPTTENDINLERAVNGDESRAIKDECEKGTEYEEIGDSDSVDLKSDQGSDLDNVSDLDDEEPVCDDVIIGHFEKVVRPYTRKKNQRGKWRVKLRNGIAQIANQEIPFDTLIGEFEF